MKNNKVYLWILGLIIVLLFTGGCFSKKRIQTPEILLDTSLCLAPTNIIRAPGLTLELVKIGDITKIKIIKDSNTAKEIREQKRLERIKLREQNRLEKIKQEAEISKAKAIRKLYHINNKKNVEAAKAEARISKSEKEARGLIMPWKVKIILVVVGIIFILICCIMLARWIHRKITT